MGRSPIPKEPLLKSKFIQKGDILCIPIARDDITVIVPNFGKLQAKKWPTTKILRNNPHVVGMMQGERCSEEFTHISVPFSSVSPVKGAYICLSSHPNPPSQLFFTFTSSKKKKIIKRFEFPEIERSCSWFLLSFDLDDIISCKIQGKGSKEDDDCSFIIRSLVYFREETPQESSSRVSREKILCRAPLVKSEFIKDGDLETFGIASIPVPRHDSSILIPSFSTVHGKRSVYSKEFERYDQSLEAQKMLKGEAAVELSHLSIPFPSPSCIKGAYLCVDKDFWMARSGNYVFFTFTQSDGTLISKQFTRGRSYSEWLSAGKPEFEWYFLPIDLSNVVLCEIQRNKKKIDLFSIFSLVFIQDTASPMSDSDPPPLTVSSKPGDVV
eukprot:gnl/Carplike_NY0171/2280_a3074_673.p1 GENE.gnl/Carplike_NY0171/2280_a3074_673~~gnl/Carplike_NY0171/2280_a3074_673.p1  ORF type:complete len:383 (-),score=57.57 gnl/Carplike_NY0171/2280_a3074_673:402-1550(-)